MNDDRPADLLLAAIHALRIEGGESAQADAGECGAPSETGSCRPDGALLRFARSQGALSSEAWLELLSPLEGGNEHEVYQDPQQPDFLLKVTEPDLRLRNGRDRIPKVTELHYLERWQLANEAFGDGVTLMCVIPTDEGNRIVIRQPFVAATEPETPNPDQRDINRWLHAAGFEYQSGAWLRKADGLVMIDTHEGNFIHGLQGMRPVDVELYRLPEAVGVVIPWEQTQQRLIAAGIPA